MSNDQLIFVRDFLLKGMPWDLSRPRFMDFQCKQIRDKTQADPTFPDKLRQVALEALKSEESEVIQRGLTALAFVGTRADLPTVEKLKIHKDPNVSRYAGTCLFEIKKNNRVAKKP